MENGLGPPGAAITGSKWEDGKHDWNTVQHEADKNNATETLSIDLKMFLKTVNERNLCTYLWNKLILFLKIM